MKKYFWLLISPISLSCYQSQQSIAPDAAARIAGVYDLTYTIAYQREYTNQPGSLTLVRTDAQRVKPTFQLFANSADSSSSQGYWQLTEVGQDSISYRGSGCSGGVKNGQITMAGYGDGVFFFRFAKRK